MSTAEIKDVGMEIADGIAHIRFDRPAEHNSTTLPLLDGTRALLDRAEQARVSAVVLSGGGDKAFCAGGDLNIARGLAQTGLADNAAASAILVSLHALVRRMQTMPCPTIAAIEGPAIGAGLGIAMSVDLRIMGRRAILVGGFGRVGATPDGGVSYWLTRAIGGAAARSALVTNRPITADRALAMGLCEEVVEDGSAAAAALAFAGALPPASPSALVKTRELIDLANTQSLDAQLDAEEAATYECWKGHDFPEGVRAVLEKRRPEFEPPA